MAQLLVLDNDSVTLVNLKTYLEDEGHEVWVGQTAEQGLGLLSVKSVDILILETHMLGLPVEKLIAEALRVSPSVQVILHTGAVDYLLPDSLEQLGVSPENILFKSHTSLDQLGEKITQITSN